MGFATPEEAAGGDVPAEHIRVVGVVVRRDEALVMQIINADGYPNGYEIDTTRCFRDADGWEGSVSGNGNTGFIRTDESSGTLVVWLDRAPADAVAARFLLDDREAVFPVEDGCVVAVFDNVPSATDWPSDYPALDEWITSANR
ncbi:MAG: hypothetical protein ACJ757_09375 [Gaiellaceae bacterium]